ncbi:MAG: ribose 5-phosphate isomerase B [Sphingomonadales bacterium]
MSNETIVVGSDHAGFSLKETLKEALKAKGFETLDVGTNSPDSVDYPDFAHKLAKAIEDGTATRGVLVCGSGIGISIAANRHSVIRAVNSTSPEMAKLARQHNDANVLALGERLVDESVALECLDAFLNTDFEGGRHQARVEKI